MALQRTLLALLFIAAAAAVAGSTISDSMGHTRRGLKDTAKNLNLQSSLTKAVRNALKHTVTASHSRPEDRSLISLPGQAQTVNTCSPMLLPHLTEAGASHC